MPKKGRLSVMEGQEAPYATMSMYEYVKHYNDLR